MTDREKTLVSDEEANLENAECADQEVELDMADLDRIAGGKSAPHYPPFKGLGSKDVYDRMMQLENHTFRR